MVQRTVHQIQHKIITALETLCRAVARQTASADSTMRVDRLVPNLWCSGNVNYVGSTSAYDVERSPAFIDKVNRSRKRTDLKFHRAVNGASKACPRTVQRHFRINLHIDCRRRAVGGSTNSVKNLTRRRSKHHGERAGRREHQGKSDEKTQHGNSFCNYGPWGASSA